MKRKISKRFYLLLAVIILTLITVIAAAMIITARIRKMVNGQAYANLADVAEQSANAVKKEIDNYWDLLENFQTELFAMEGDPKENLPKLQKSAELSGLKRLALSYPNGKTYASDYSDHADAADRDFFIRGMEGKKTISNAFTDRFEDHREGVNVIATPVYAETDKTTVECVFSITIDFEHFNKSLQVKSYGGNGYDCTVDEKGVIVSDMDGTGEELSQNLLAILSREKENEQVTTDIQKQLSEDIAGSGVAFLNGEQNIYHQIPIKLLGGDVVWHVFTLIPTSYVTARLKTLNDSLILLFAIIILVVAVSLVLIMLITGRHRKLIEKIAYEDPVTGGDNMPMFLRHMRDMRVKSGSFVAMDMFEFNSVIIAVGAQDGNFILREINSAISSMLGDDECIAHVGRDKYLLFLATTDEEKVKARLNGFNNKMLELSNRLGIPHLRANFGVYIAENFTKESVEVCYHRAEQASEMAIRHGGISYWFYSERDNMEMLVERNLAGSFEQALKNGEFEVWYQPKYNAKTREIVGSEALVRWRKDGGLVSPSKFIPLFERNGMIARLDEYMFRSVSIHQKARQEAGKKIVPVSVNLSRATIYNDNVADKYIKILKDLDLDANFVQIEITESAMVGKTDITDLLEKFKEAGELILLDDFGTGYSSLSMLSLKCFDNLKIDKSLVDTIGGESGEALLTHIIQMAHQLGMRVTAEGVENAAQLQFLQSLDCDVIQGFYLSRPLPREEYEALLDRAERVGQTGTNSDKTA